MILECQGVNKSYPSANGNVLALDDISFGVDENRFVSIVGPSGCGKTTLLKVIAGLIKPSSGKIIFGKKPEPEQLQTALVFQEHGLFPWRTIVDNVAFVLEMRGVGTVHRRDRARSVLDTVGLLDFAECYPNQLSAGMRQRAGIARAFLAAPQILLMDEPFGALDAQTRLVLQEELLRTWANHSNSVVYVTHDIEEAILLGDVVLVLTGRPGRIRELVTISKERPRDLRVLQDPEMMKIKWHIWDLLKPDTIDNRKEVNR